MGIFKKYTKKITILVLLIAIILASLAVKVVNLNYNSPFNDEAIYVVVGKLGVFEKDWETLVPFEWMAGVPYFYPSISAFAYELGGIEASRFLNVVFFALTAFLVYKIAYLLSEGKDKVKEKAGCLAAAIFAGSSVGYYVSRLATYDMPSFFFFALSLYFFILAEQARRLPGRKYILSAIFLVVAFFFKYIIALYVPILLAFSFFVQKTSYRKRATLVYFALPLVMAFFVFGITQFKSLGIYISVQTELEIKSPLVDMLVFVVNQIGLILPFWVVGSYWFYKKEKLRVWAFFTFFSFIIILFHVLNQRLHTLDKHILLAIGGLAVSAGIGVSNMIKHKVHDRILLLGIGVFWVLSFVVSLKYNSAWVNAYSVMDFVGKNSHSEDVVLSEIGAITQLDLYEKVNPLRVFTFDWIYYDEHEGEEALVNGVSDGYFNTIILETQEDGKSDFNSAYHELIVENREFNRIYSNIYSDDHFEVYRRNY